MALHSRCLNQDDKHQRRPVAMGWHRVAIPPLEQLEQAVCHHQKALFNTRNVRLFSCPGLKGTTVQLKNHLSTPILYPAYHVCHLGCCLIAGRSQSGFFCFALPPPKKIRLALEILPPQLQSPGYGPQRVLWLTQIFELVQ